MFESKYSKVLTVILVIVIVAILGLLAFLGYDWYQKYFLENDALAFVENYTENTEKDNNKEENTENGENSGNTGNVSNPIDQIESSGSNTSNSGKKLPQYKGFDVVGTMDIPATNFHYPILKEVTKASIEKSVAMLYGAGINQVGNTVIIGHNYRNGLFFSNNKKLKNGDKIYITDNSGNKLTYTIYNKFEASPDDASFYNRDTQGKPEVTLSTCTDNNKARTIIFARAD
ncbi:MAG: sortase [Clostridia bacterium]|nr:sortase [Clostridium sp.]